eukprot:TRINITY_DN9083_c0_g1_i1.p1 TRINITY_DN9083_c0_g1~~TRINITY_DN9083_c0_g1_i1.p1  ORF type:complete len:181 (+),score=36.96 TRINITY_DN9083_c0_g1_i1:448-990(+)
MTGAQAKRPYFERQCLAFCALHTLNCALQRREYTAQRLNAICEQLTPAHHSTLLGCLRNPHRTPLIGNYDVNVLTRAFLDFDLDLQWVRCSDDLAKRLLDTEIVVVNAAVPGILTWLIGGRHWYCVRRVEGQWYNLNSQLDAPRLLGSAKEALAFLTPLQQSPRCQIFVVVERAETQKSE